MPGDSGVLVYSCAYLLLQSAHEAAGATGTRHSPRPLMGESFMHDPGEMRRGVANACLPSLRVNGSSGCAPDDRLREAIHLAAQRKNGLLRRCAPRDGGLQLKSSLGSVKIEPNNKHARRSAPVR